MGTYDDDGNGTIEGSEFYRHFVKLGVRERRRLVTKFFIHRPIFACAIALLMLLVGGVSILTLPVSQYPDIVPGTVQVTSSYAGANAETTARVITQPLEQQINGVEGMIYMSSKSRNDGSYQLTVTFEVGRDPDLATVDVQNRVNRATSKLPPEVVQNGITVQKQSTQILMVIMLYSPDESRDNLFLSNYTSINLLDPLGLLHRRGGSQGGGGGHMGRSERHVVPSGLRRRRRGAARCTWHHLAAPP